MDTDHRTLADAVRGADVFYGLSVANVLTPEMVKTMAERPIIFAMANPDPEIKYELAKEARPDVIVATGRSDYPNQVNNVLGFPFIFRGALDVRAKAINEEMKFAASQALYNLTKEDVPDSVLRAYGVESMKFGMDYIIPKPLDPRVLLWEAPAVAKAAMETGVARKKIDMDEYREQLAYRLGKGEQVRYFYHEQGQSSKGKKRVVFGEGEETKIIRAAVQVKEEGIATPILIGRPKIIQSKIKELLARFHLRNRRSRITSPNIEKYAKAYYELRQRKGMTLQQAQKAYPRSERARPDDGQNGRCGCLCLRSDLRIPGCHPPGPADPSHAKGGGLAAGVYIMIIEDRRISFTDATVNIDPTAEDLAEIACLAANFAKQMEIEPRVAFLSFSNFGSTPHPLSDKVSKAVELVKKQLPGLRGGWRDAGGYRGGAGNHRRALPLQRGQGCQCAGLPVARIRPTSPTNCWPAWATPRPSARSCSAWARPSMCCRPVTR